MLQPDWSAVARTVLLSRQMDDLEEQELTPQGKVKYQFSAAGHELAQVLLAQALTHPHDAAAVYYRSRPFLLASGMTATEALCAGMALSNSPSQGRDVGVVFNLPRRTGATVLPASGAVGAQYTPAVGWAQAIEYRQKVLQEPDWEGALVVAMGGDGSVAANGFWAALNIVTTLKLPFIFFIEDNQFGLSVPASLQTPSGNIAENLRSYKNLMVREVDGSQPAETWFGIQEVVQAVRLGNGPALVRVCVPRLRGHTFVDNQAYKSQEQRERELARDPLPALQKFLENEKILDPAGWSELEKETQEKLRLSLQEAETTPEPDPETAARFLYFDGTPPAQGGLRPEGAHLETVFSSPQPAGQRLNLIDAMRRTLEHEMRLNPRLLVFGEDVGVKGGVHGATQDMQVHFGAERVFDTSLSEEGIIGRAVGMALAGLLPVPEIQFRKYADPAHEQISDLGTLRWRTANRFAAPVVVRIPVGYAKKTGDPWHSVSGEAVYAHLPGWRIAYPSNAEDAVGLLRTALRGDDPTFFFEHRALLDSAEARRPYPGDEYCLPFGKAARLTRGDELTLISWGAMVPRCLEAASQFPGRVLVLDLRTIIPWDEETVLESVSSTGKLLVVHEDTWTNGFGAEILATVSHKAFQFLDAPPQRMAAPDIPIPFNVNLMNAILPDVSQIKARIQELLAW
jgi:2-oxoisovalerate dehydrogenase E1 component